MNTDYEAVLPKNPFIPTSTRKFILSNLNENNRNLHTNTLKSLISSKLANRIKSQMVARYENMRESKYILFEETLKELVSSSEYEKLNEEDLCIYMDYINSLFESDPIEIEQILYSNKNTYVSICPKCSDFVFLTNKRLFCSSKCFQIKDITMFHKNFNLDNFIDLYRKLLAEHDSCSNQFICLRFEDRIEVICTDCYYI